MPNIFFNFQKKIKELQRAPAPVKKRWVTIFSCASMALVLALWIGYLNVNLPKIAPEEEPDLTPSPAAAEGQKMSFFSTLNRGFAIIGRNLLKQTSSLKNDFLDTANFAKNEWLKNKNPFNKKTDEKASSTGQ